MIYIICTKNPLFIQQYYKEVEEQEEKKQPQQGEPTEIKEQTAGGAVKWDHRASQSRLSRCRNSDQGSTLERWMHDWR